MAELKDEFYNRLLFLVQEFTDDEECFGDAAQLRINPETLEADIIDDPDEDKPEFDYYDLGDLIMPHTDGNFAPDADAIKEITETYIKNNS